MKVALAEAVSDAVCKEMGPILEAHANRISQQELSYRTDKKVRITYVILFSGHILADNHII